MKETEKNISCMQTSTSQQNVTVLGENPVWRAFQNQSDVNVFIKLLHNVEDDRMTNALNWFIQR